MAAIQRGTSRQGGASACVGRNEIIQLNQFLHPSRQQTGANLFSRIDFVMTLSNLCLSVYILAICVDNACKIVGESKATWLMFRECGRR
jgi:hypothetical protein